MITIISIVYCITNLQGDVVVLMTGDGTIVARYSYDSRGMPLTITDASGNAITDQNNIALINPFRCRGYYCNTETGLYCLQRRYYDLQVCRFMNADGYISTGQGLPGYHVFG